jgi:GH35 family endo-1,4-beta-xylanase
MKKQLLAMLLLGTIAVSASAQSLPAALSSNPNKFLGNITTRGSVEAGGGVPQYYTLWNQITCENESKWSSVEGNRGNFNWGGADNAFNYAKQHGFTHKFHALVWGSQYPNWVDNLSAGERFSAMTNWFDHAKAHYETLPMIDVVNEAVGNHQAGNAMIKETLGGGGKTGYDWLIKAFEMAYERWPDAILIYNDYNSIQYDIDPYIDLVRTLRDAGAPIDAYGNQSHAVANMSSASLQAALDKQQNALKMPMFITELDINTANDDQQKSQYQQVLPVMWEAPYCAGVTLWGYIHGATWVDNSGLYKNGVERPAMTWIKEYMQTDAAKNAVSPFPGVKKEASIYIRPAALKAAAGDVLPIKVRAKMATKTIEKIDLYVNDELVTTMTEEPYIAEHTANSPGWNIIKAVVTTTDGSTYERLSRFQVTRGAKRKPYNDVVAELPGTIKVEEYDEGMSGVAYSNASRTSYAMKDNQWMEYTVDVKEDGLYSMEVEVASSNANGMFHLSEYGFDNLTFHTNITQVPNTGGSSTFQTLRCPMMQPLTAGRHTFCLNIDKGGFYIKSMTFKALPVVELPGTLETEDFTSGESISIISGNGGSVLGNTTTGEWLEYDVNITQAGKYSFEATISSAIDNSSFKMTLIESDGNEKTLGTITVPNTGSLNTYQVKTGKIRNSFKEGKQKLRITIVNGGCNIDKVAFICTTPTGIISAETDQTATATQWFTPEGRRLTTPQKGLNIERTVINGKTITRKVIR